jgi:CubicO group peptidase (beta-lactamase class C family)
MIDRHTERLLAARLAGEQSRHRLPSACAGIVRRGTLAWSGGRGQVGGTAGPTPDSGVQYRAGSITKTFIAVAVLRLRDEGRLELSDPVGRHLDAPGASELPIGQLLAHASGLRAETPGPWWERVPGAALRGIAGALGADPQRLRPGARHHYSNVGYALLGELIERLTGQPWYEVISEQLLAPLGMSRTTLRPEAPHALGFAVHPHADLLLPEPEHDAGVMAPAGQLWTTVADLSCWAAFLAGTGSGLLGAGTLAEMRVPAGINDVPGQPWTTGYGLGLQLWNDGGRRSYGHTGSMPGFFAMLQVDAASGDAAIAMANSTAGFSYGFAGDLLRILAEHEPMLRPEWSPSAVAEDVAGLLGTWYRGPIPFLASVSGGMLEFRMAGGAAWGFRFSRGDDGTWTGLDDYYEGERLAPVTGPDGRIIALDLASHTYTRTPYDPAAPVPGGVDPGGWVPASAQM